MFQPRQPRAISGLLRLRISNSYGITAPTTTLRTLTTTSTKQKDRVPSATYYNRNPTNLMFTKHVPKHSVSYFEIFFHEEEDPTTLIAKVKDHRGEVIFEIDSKQILEGTLPPTDDKAAAFLGEAVGQHCRNAGVVAPCINRRGRPKKGKLTIFKESLKASLRQEGEVGRTVLV